jgi:hypothetical protein
VTQPSVANDGCASGKEVPAVHIILSEPMRDRERVNLLPTQELLQTCDRVRELTLVVEGRKPASAENAVDLSLSALLYVGIDRHRENEVFECDHRLV